MKYEGKTAVITAAGSGMGREIAMRFAAGGAHVYAADIDASAVDETLSLVRKAGGSGASIKCDVGSDDDMASLVERVLAERGGVDYLFNHAGIPLGGVLEQITSEDWLWMLNINVVGMARAIRGFLPSMMDRKSGYIINTSSGLGLFPVIPAALPYATSKAAVVAMSRALQQYVQPHGINVSVFCPDITLTKFHWSGRWIGVTKEELDANLPLDLQQPVDTTINYLLDCMDKRKFLVSLTPDYRESLIQYAEAEYELGAGQIERLVAENTSG